MRSIIFGTLMASGMVLVSIPGATAMQLGSGVRGVIGPESTVQQVQGRRYCDELRRACLNKNRLGEKAKATVRNIARSAGPLDIGQLKDRKTGHRGDREIRTCGRAPRGARLRTSNVTSSPPIIEI